MAQRSIRFPDDLEQRATELAATDDRTFSYIAREALETWVNQREREQLAREQAEDLGRYLSTTGLPPASEPTRPA